MQFAPTGSNVSLLIRAPISGPSESQRRFLEDLQSRYQQLLAELVDEFRAQVDELQLPSDIGFELNFVEVPASPGDGASWKLGFSTVPPNWDLSVAMQGWEPVFVVPER